MTEPYIFELLSQIADTSSNKEEVGQKRKIREGPITAFLNLLKRQPDAAKQKKHGRTPLHMACRHGASCEVVAALLEVWPEAVKEKDRVGRTPLFLACRHGASCKVVAAVLEVWPEA
eukprot:7186622-Ditylum_brightwellii.AAC.1